MRLINVRFGGKLIIKVGKFKGQLYKRIWELLSMYD